MVKPIAPAGGTLLVALPALAKADDALTVDLAEFSVTPEKSSVSAGQVDFTVRNVGSFPDELVVVRPDLASSRGRVRET